jgi:hypothetical protein
MTTWPTTTTTALRRAWLRLSVPIILALHRWLPVLHCLLG